MGLGSNEPLYKCIIIRTTTHLDERTRPFSSLTKPPKNWTEFPKLTWCNWIIYPKNREIFRGSSLVLYLLNKSHVGCCLSSSPWIFISFRSSFSEWWVSPNRVYICAVLCKLQSPRIRLLLLITHHSFISTVTTRWKDLPNGEGTDLLQGKRKRDYMSLSFIYDGHSTTSIDVLYVCF